MRHATLIVLVLALILLLATGVSIWRRPAATLLMPPGRAAVTRGDLEATVESIGRVRALHEARLSLPIGGQVIEVMVTEGDTVTAGRPLLRIDPTEASARLEEARLHLLVAQAQLEKAEAGATAAEVEAAQAQVRRAQVALAAAQAAYDAVADEPDAATSDEAVRLEAARADLQNAEASLRRAVERVSPEERSLLQRQIELATLRLKAAEQGVSATTLTAPFAGIITHRDIEPGERLGPNQPILTLAAPGTLRAVAEVDEIDVAHVATGQPATVRLDALPTAPISGTVEHIAPAALPQRSTTVYETIIRLEDPPPAVRLGMVGTVTIQTAAAQDALILPLSAVRRAGRDTYVVRLRGGREEEVGVTLGPSDGTRVAILEGLEEGDVVLLP